jgi:hypothetical protein
VVEVIDGMDLRAMSGSYRGSGSASYHPRMLLGILVYGYATGIFSSPENPTPVEAMAHRLKTPEGRKLYALRKQTPEPVFSIIKSVLGFRQFLLRGLDKVRGEWSLVTMAWNIKRMFTLSAA